ncbi:nitric oxide reductase activation protein NorD [uncultured Cocleimonas sp.]|uniref:nitric oxide reductase activation protein NorD n=1 Tax=uncultured Cocleimonas sp. TaxID=1051587 RepID=UPI00261A5322|nr:VWA domain-containing protein [uncultured Cocleimonas sp.]
MGFFKNLLKRYREPLKFKLPESGPTLTAVSGGMGTTELLIRLEMVLNDIKSKKPIIDHAYELAGFSHNLQSRLLSDLSDISETSYEHGYEFLTVSAAAISSMEQTQYDKWVYDIKSLLADGYDDKASELISKHPSYIEAPHIVNLNTISEKLEKLIYSIYEKDIPILVANEVAKQSSELSTINTAYTDGFQIYLPAKISYFDNYEDNFKLFKIQMFHLLEQIQSINPNIINALGDGIKNHGKHYLKLFGDIETLRVDQTIKDNFPGVWRDIDAINNKTDTPHLIGTFSNDALNTIEDSLRLTTKYINNPPALPELIYQPVFIPELTREAMKDGKASPLNEEKDENAIEEAIADINNTNNEFRQETNLTDQMLYDDDEQVKEQDSDKQQNIEDVSSANQELEKPKAINKFYYKEWDTSLKKYRKDWCQVEEVVSDNLIENKQIETSPHLKHIESRIKKTLDLLVNEQKSMRFQSDGDDIDIDAWVDARSNRSKNADDYQNLYIRNNKSTRNVAIMFAVDISGSTRGWKNTAIKESTSVLCKTLARLEDQYAVYAFSGSGRNNCQIYPIKSFTESNNNKIQSRIFSMQPQQYTRMGAAIRHLGTVLSKTSAKTRILFVLTDGKPDDVDSYRGQYAIEDTRRALNEAKALQLNPFVLTFDKEGMDYLPHMLGSNRYQLISDVSQLPVQISTIYKHLTS